MTDTTGSRIVVLDDELADLRLLERVLTQAGYDNVLTTADPEWLEETFDPLKTDLLILDLHMPGIDGFEMLRRLRMATPSHVYLPIVVITADADASSRRKALSLGASDFLTKPFDVTEVILRVQNLLETRKLHSELAASNSRLEDAVASRTEELALANALLEKEAKERDQFIAGLSHELKTPLTSVMGFAQELADRLESLSKSEVFEASRIIADEAAEVGAIVEDLLVAARFRQGTIQVIREQVDLRNELVRVVRSLSVDARERIAVPDDTASAVADSLRVRQILRNLLSNALRHGGPSISVGIGVDSEGAFVVVFDDGAGIPGTETHRMFDPYYRGKLQMSLPATIGLGLTVSRQLARLMGGDLLLARDHGPSAFRLSLPNAAI